MTTTEVTVFEGWELDTSDPAEPRARDIDIATRAGMKQPRNVRTLIEKNSEELTAHGALSMRTQHVRIEKAVGIKGTPVVEERTVNEYWLNEAQSVALISMKPSSEVQS